MHPQPTPPLPKEFSNLLGEERLLQVMAHRLGGDQYHAPTIIDGFETHAANLLVPVRDALEPPAMRMSTRANKPGIKM